MFASLKTTLKHSIIYGLGNISTKFIGFLLLPLYTEYLTVEEYGILAIIEVTIQIIVSIFSFNISTAMMRWCADTSDENKQKSIISTTLFSSVVISIIIFLISLPFINDFSFVLFDNYKFTNYIILLFITSSFSIYNLFPLTLMRLREKSTTFAVLNTLKFALTLILNFYFIVSLELGIEGILISLLIGQIFLTLFSLPLVLKNINFKFQFSILKEMISYGLPLIFTTIFTLLLTISDRFIIKYYQGDASVGIYSLGHKIASVINIIILQSFQLGFLPIAYKKITAPDSQRFFSKTLTYYTFALVISSLAITLFSKEIIMLFAQKEEYWASYSVIPIITFGFVLKGIQYVFSLSFHYSKKTTYNAIIVIISAIINIVLNIVLIQRMGYIGAAYAMLISSLIMLFLSYYYGQKVYYVKYEERKLYLLVLVGISFYFISIFLNDFNIVLRLFTKFLLLCLFPIMLFPFKFYESVEIERIKKIFTRIVMQKFIK